MSAFFSDVLDDLLSPGFLETVCRKFHFTKNQMPEMYAAAKEMLPCVRRDAFWESKGYGEKNRTSIWKHAPIRESVVISLGSGLDRLLEDYNRNGLLSETYMTDALAAELLLHGYDAYDRYIQRTMGQYVKAYHFPGSEAQFPIEMLPGLLKELTQKVVCSASYCMQPRNSVVFIAELTQDIRDSCAGICQGCSRIDCPNRSSNDRSRQKGDEGDERDEERIFRTLF